MQASDSPSSVPVWKSRALILYGCAAIALAATAGMSVVQVEGPSLRRDFDSFYAAGALYFQPNANIYDLDQPTEAMKERQAHRPVGPPGVNPMPLLPFSGLTGMDARLFGVDYIEPYLYPPPLAFALGLLHEAGAGAALVHAFWTASMVLCLAALPLLMALYPAWTRGASLRSAGDARDFAAGLILLACLGFSLRDNFFWSQVNVFTAFLAMLAMTLRHRLQFLAGASIAIAACIKLTPAAFGLVFLARRNWRAVTGAVAAGLFVVAASLAVAPERWAQFLEAAPQVSAGNRMMAGLLPAWLPSNLSLKGFVYRVLPTREEGHDSFWAALAAALFGYLILRSALDARQSRPDATERMIYRLGFFVILISPIAWLHHLVLLYPSLAALYFLLGVQGLSAPARFLVWAPLAAAPALPYFSWFGFPMPLDMHWLTYGLLTSIHFYVLLIWFFLPDWLEPLLDLARRRGWITKKDWRASPQKSAS